MATALGMSWLAVLLYLDAIVSPGDTGLIYTTITKTTDKGVPMVSLIVTFFVGLVVFLAFWASNMIVFWSGWDIVWKLMVAVLLGFIPLGVFMVTGRVPSTGLDLVSGAAWLLPWLAATTLISWLGTFPEPYAGNIGKLDFDTALLAEFVLSALIYLLAYRFRLSPEEAAEHIEISRREAEVTEDQLAG